MHWTRRSGYVLDQLLGLDIAHAVHTRNTVTGHIVSYHPLIFVRCSDIRLPDRKNTASLSEAGLLLHATDSLLEDGGDLGRGGLGVGGIAAGEGVDDSGCRALL